MLYLSRIQLSHVYGPIAHGVLHGGLKSKWRNTGFGDYEPSTVSVFLSIIKCSRACKAQTCIHSATLAKGFLQGGPKNFEFLSISRYCVPICQQQLQLEAYDLSQEKILVPPLSTCRRYIGVSPTTSRRSTGWVKKLVTQYQFCALRL